MSNCCSWSVTMIRCTVRVVIEHLAAIAFWLGQQLPASSAISASARRTSFGVGGNGVAQAQVMTRILTAVC